MMNSQKFVMTLSNTYGCFCCSNDGGSIMTIKEEIFDQIEELNTSLRELNDFDLVDCRLN